MSNPTAAQSRRAMTIPVALTIYLIMMAQEAVVQYCMGFITPSVRGAKGALEGATFVLSVKEEKEKN